MEKNIFNRLMSDLGYLFQQYPSVSLSDEEFDTVEACFIEYENIPQNAIDARYVVLTSKHIIIYEQVQLSKQITVKRIRRDTEFLVTEKEYAFYHHAQFDFPIGYRVKSISIKLQNGEAYKFDRPMNNLAKEHYLYFENFVKAIKM